MPAKAECPEVAEAAAVQAKVVRVAQLMDELAAVTAKAEPEEQPPAVAEKPPSHKIGEADSAKRQSKDAKDAKKTKKTRDTSAARRKHDTRTPAKVEAKPIKAQRERKAPPAQLAKAAATPPPPTTAKSGAKSGSKTAARVPAKIAATKSVARNTADKKSEEKKVAASNGKSGKVAAQKSDDKVADKQPAKRDVKRKSRPSRGIQFASFFSLFDFK
jgi:hypothetical protein